MEVPTYQDELSREYDERFSEMSEYRNRIWKTLIKEFFSAYVPTDAHVLDLGCGWGEFINNVSAAKKYALDLNPEASRHLNDDVAFLCQDCSAAWPIDDDSLDIVFTSNFFEHIPDKQTLRKTLSEAHRCLRKGGKIICMGPNIKHLPGRYWDFWDHFLPLTELSLQAMLVLSGFQKHTCLPKFMPYTMVGKREAPVLFVKWYLRFPWAWRILGKQFLVIGLK